MSNARLPDNSPPHLTPIIYIVDCDLFQSQLLVDLLQRKFKAECFCRQGLSLSAIMALNPTRLTVCLFDWAGLEGPAAAEKRLNPGSTPCPPHILPVICNVDPAVDITRLARGKALRGIFYAGESLESFIEGLGVILKGKPRLKRRIPGGFSSHRAKPAASPAQPLTPREIELLRQVASGANNRQIAERLGISPHTVKTHLYNIFRKIGAPNRLQAALWAVANLRE
jgi:DNA-binding CsgD family transcriptional regulator